MKVPNSISKRVFLASGALVFLVAASCSSCTGSLETAGSSGSTAAPALTTFPPPPPPPTPSPPPPTPPPPLEVVCFFDHFEGTTLDTEIWNTSIVTSGVRWCGPYEGRPGQWCDVSLSPYLGVIQSLPFGAVGVSGSKADFSAGVGRCFPYIWAGPPSRPSPVPETGDFVFEISIRWSSVATHGPWIALVGWTNTDPVGSNTPIPPEVPVFGTMACKSRQWRVFPPGADWIGVPAETGISLDSFDPLVWHIIRVECVGGIYTGSIDGQRVFGPLRSSLRPNTIWIGSPGFASWAAADHSDFSIDFIRVTVPKQGSLLSVAIDVKPGSHPDSPIHLGGKGTLPVAILGSSGFDVTSVDPSTVELSGAHVRVKPNGERMASLEDVDGDGLADLVLHVETEELGLADSATEAVLTGLTFEGQAIEGRDNIRVVPPMR